MIVINSNDLYRGLRRQVDNGGYRCVGPIFLPGNFVITTGAIVCHANKRIHNGIAFHIHDGGNGEPCSQIGQKFLRKNINSVALGQIGRRRSRLLPGRLRVVVRRLGRFRRLRFFRGLWLFHGCRGRGSASLLHCRSCHARARQFFIGIGAFGSEFKGVQKPHAIRIAVEKYNIVSCTRFQSVYLKGIRACRHGPGGYRFIQNKLRRVHPGIPPAEQTADFRILRNGVIGYDIIVNLGGIVRVADGCLERSRGGADRGGAAEKQQQRKSRRNDAGRGSKHDAHRTGRLPVEVPFALYRVVNGEIFFYIVMIFIVCCGHGTPSFRINFQWVGMALISVFPAPRVKVTVLPSWVSV